MLLVVVDEDVPVVLGGADEPDDAHGLGKGDVLVVPCGAAGPGLGGA